LDCSIVLSEPSECPFQVVLSQLDTYPLAAQSLADLSSHTAASKWINDEIAFIGKHADKKFGKLDRESSRMRGEVVFPAVAEVRAVAVGIRDSNQIGRDRRAIVCPKSLADIMP